MASGAHCTYFRIFYFLLANESYREKHYRLMLGFFSLTCTIFSVYSRRSIWTSAFISVVITIVSVPRSSPLCLLVAIPSSSSSTTCTTCNMTEGKIQQGKGESYRQFAAVLFKLGACCFEVCLEQSYPLTVDWLLWCKHVPVKTRQLSTAGDLVSFHIEARCYDDIILPF